MGHILSADQRQLSGPEPEVVSSLLETLDPRSRIMAAAVFSIAVVSLDKLTALVAALVVSLLALSLIRLAWRNTLHRMAAMDGFIIFMLVLLPFTVPGESIFQVFGFGVSLEGILKAVMIGLKANAVILMLMVLVGTMEPVALGHGFYRLKVPETLVHLLMFTVRYIAVLHQEYGRMRAAMKARGFRLTNRMHTYRSLGYLVGMMLVRSVDRSEHIFAAMRCRGFNGTIHLVDDPRFCRADCVFAALALGVVLLLFVLEVAPGAAY
ncbi:cobalt ECF transporter T component CbiQ [Breoghania sp.]|uniref:cobalt ECF transporter T component CbiQ n=1 Tax=Breoghania sp. TaxID=2065378 RepID=UPI002604F97F|nr:cobalt ECF transporter T component CbiQ [Breoghania sp.]MDJ0931503.1 cobalt ECF transporter T component CbiQ [Breoghania sp.]